jgi:hypothetical protein
VTIAMNTAIRPRSVYWRRRAVVAAAGATGMIMLIHSCAGGGPPHLQITAKEAPSVPVLSTYTPTPTPTVAVTPSVAPDVVAAAGGPAAATTPTSVSTAKPTPVASAPAKGTKNQAVPAVAAPPAPPAAGAAGVAAAVPAAAVVPGCAKSDLAVELRTDSPEYSGRAKPKFYIGVSNIGQSPCQVDLGSVALLFTVRSGPDRIWSSRDCQGKGTHDVRTLTPGQKLWGRSIWSKARSKRGCPADESDAQPGTYTLEGWAAGVKAQKRIVFRIR